MRWVNFSRFVGSRPADFGAEVIKIETPVPVSNEEWGHHRYKEVFGGLHWLETKSVTVI